MPQFTHAQHKEVIAEALGFLDQFGLDNPPPSGRTLRSEIEDLFLDAIKDDLSPGAIPALLYRMTKVAMGKVENLAGVRPDLPDDFGRTPDGGDSIQ